MDSRNQRQALDRLIRERGDDYQSVSRLLGRNVAYVQQFIKRGVPRKLSEDDRRYLAAYFGVDERTLGGPVSNTSTERDLISIPILDISASAGHGAITDPESERSAMEFDRQWIKHLNASSAEQLSVVQMRGDSMAPTICEGDDVMVDTGDHVSRLRDGIYVLRIDDDLVAKRLAVRPGDRTISILSDNPAYPSYDNLNRETLDIFGRVRWFGRVIR